MSPEPDGAAYDINNLRYVGEDLLTNIAQYATDARSALTGLNSAWADAFAELGWPLGERYGAVEGDWVEVYRGFEDILSETYFRVTDAGVAIVRIAETYAGAEADAVNEIPADAFEHAD